MSMTRWSRVRIQLFLTTMATLLIAIFPAKAEPTTSDENTAKKHFDSIVREIEGWKVHIDPKMLEGEHSAEGTRTLSPWCRLAR